MFQTSPKRLYSLLVIFIITCAAFSYPQSDRTVYKILGISVQGNNSADASTIIANSGLKVNDEIQIPGDRTLNAIRQLWALNIFSDVQVLIDKHVGDGVFLVIKVTEYPRFEKLVFEGNDELSEEKLTEKGSFTRGTILKPQELARFNQKIIKQYEEEGYLNVKIETLYYSFFAADTNEDGDIDVTWRNDKDLADEYKITYEKSDIIYSNLVDRLKTRKVVKLKIDEGKEVVVRDIEFNGNTAFDDGDLRGAMDDIETSKWWKFWSSANFNAEKYKTDKKKIIEYYYKNGYRDAEILSDTLIYSNENKDLRIEMNVYEGPQYKLRNIEWEGNTVYGDDALNARLDFRKGDVYDYQKLQMNLRQNEKQNDVSSLYLDNGYLTFNLNTNEQRIPPDSIDLTIRIQENNQFKIRRVDIFGNDKTKDKVIRRELYTIPGDYFNRALLFRSVQNLANLQFFNVEKLYGAEGINYNLSSDSTVDVSFSVEEKSSDYLNASVGYSGSYGFSGAIGVTLTNFSIAEPFSLGGGQVLSFNWQFGVGNIYRTFTLGFTEPWLYDTPTLVGVELFDTRQQYVYDLSQRGGTLKVGRRLKWPDDFFSVQGLFRYQYNNVLNGQNYYVEGVSHQYTLGATISRRDIDNPIFPSQGSSIALDGEISGGPFLPGDVDYYKLTFKAEWYKRLFNTNRVSLYTSADYGYIEELTKGTSIQPFEYFYMGGNGLVIATTPLRGYDDRTVGPKNSAGTVIGGKVMMKYTAEFRVAVAMEPIPLYLLAFAEAGNVYENIHTAEPFTLRRSLGVGARIMINPIGLIGFDLGYGFDRKEVDGNDPSWMFHFQFGKGF